MFFEVTPPRPKIRSQPSEEEVAVLSLAPFSPVPKICFENVKIGVNTTRKLCIKNPSAYIVDVNVLKIPEVDNEEIDLSWTSTDIAACGDTILELHWCPKVPGTWRDVLRISNERSKLKRDVYVIFKAVIPPQKKSPTKQRGRIVSSRPSFVTTKVRKIYNNKKRLSISPKKNSQKIDKKPQQKNFPVKNSIDSTIDITFRKPLVTNSPYKQPRNNTSESIIRKSNKENYNPNNSAMDNYTKRNHYDRKYSDENDVSFNLNINQHNQNIDFSFHSTGNRNISFDFKSPSSRERTLSNYDYYNRKFTFDVLNNRPEISVNDIVVNRKETFDIINRPIIHIEDTTRENETFNDSLENIIEDNVGKEGTQANFSTLLNSESFCFTPIDKKSKQRAPFANNTLFRRLDTEIKFSPVNYTNDVVVDSLNKYNRSTPVNDTFDITHNVSTNTFTKENTTPLVTPQISPLSTKNLNVNQKEDGYGNQFSFLHNCDQISPILRGSFNTNASLTSQANISTSTQKNFDFNYSGRQAKNVIEANLWSENNVSNNGSTFNASPKHLKVLSCIQEETQTSYESPFKKPLHQFPRVNDQFNSPMIDRKTCIKRKSPHSMDSYHHGNSPPRKVTMLDENRRSTTCNSWTKVDVLKMKRLSMRGPRQTIEKSVRLHNPDEIIYKLTNPDPFSAAITHDPFMSSTLCYDDRWVYKQEIEFKKWLNALLTPHIELECKETQSKIDVAKIWEESRNKDVTHAAPSKETVSSLYHTNNRLNSLRKKAIALFNSSEITTVLSKVMSIIERKKITIREDRNLHLDLGLQAEIMQLLLCYNPLWLRIGLESVYGETIPLRSNSDVIGLSTFIILRFFTDPFLKQKHSVANVRNVYSPTFAPAVKKFTLKKFLMLVYFLDQAKIKKLIPHDPCLFCTNAPIKESKKVLLEFSKDLLAGVGDITKYLKVAGYVLLYKQVALDEFIYAVKDLGTELRDGVRLARVMEIILMRNDLSKYMRTPAISRLQKIHNVKVALTALEEAGFVLLGDITAKDIVEGHREKTLSLLWQIIYKFRAPMFNEAAKVIQEWWRSFRVIIIRRIRQKQREALLLQKRNKAAFTLQRYFKNYLLTKKTREQYLHTILTIRKLQLRMRATILMRRERSQYLRKLNAIYTLQAHVKAFILMKRQVLEFNRQIIAIVHFQRRFRATLAMKKERKRFLEIKSSAMFIQNMYRAKLLGCKVRQEYTLKILAVRILQTHVRAYLLARQIRYAFMNLKQNVQLIQTRWRATLLMREQRSIYLKQLLIIKKVKSRFYATLLMRKQRNEYLQILAAVRIIQHRLIATIIMKVHRQKFIRLKNAVFVIQNRFRATLQMRQQRITYIIQISAIRTIQTNLKSILLMRHQREHYLRLRNSTRIIQNRLRATLVMRKQRHAYLELRALTVKIQELYRAKLLMRYTRNEYQRKLCAIRNIQQYYRSYCLTIQQRNNYLNLRKSTLGIQRKWRATQLMMQQRDNYLNLRESVLRIQRKWRATQLMIQQRNNYLNLRESVFRIQRKWRATQLMKQQRDNYLNLRENVLRIQRKWRATKLMTQQRHNYLKVRECALRIQRKWRATQLMTQQRDNYFNVRESVLRIQRKWRATQLMTQQRNNYLNLRESVLRIQRKWRATQIMKQHRDNYLKVRECVLQIQKKWRATQLMTQQRDNYLNVRDSVLQIQRKWRATRLMTQQRANYLNLRESVLRIQRKWRATKLMTQQRGNYLNLRESVLRIQRKWKATRLMRHQRTSYLNTLQQIQIQKRTHAAKIIIIHIQAFLLMKKQRRQYLYEISVIKTVQIRVRATLAMKKQRAEYLKQLCAIQTIQIYLRARFMMRKQREEFLKFKQVAIVIQRRYHASVKRNIQRAKYIQTLTAIRCIQSHLKAILAMRKERGIYVEKLRAIRLIQNYWKATLLMKKEHNNYTSRKNAICIIQKYWKATLKTKRERGKYLQVLKSVRVVQNYYRGYQLMRQQRFVFLNIKNSIILIQNRWRATLLMHHHRNDFIRTKNAAKTIQTRFRACKIRKEYLNKLQSAKIIQNYYRGYRLTKQQRSKYIHVKNSVILIQNRWRATLLMRKLKSNFIRIQVATKVIQTRFRAVLSTRQIRNDYLRQLNAITTIQKYVRSYLRMKKQREQYLKIQNCVRIIQNRWRATLTMQKYRCKYLELLHTIKEECRNNAAKTIQLHIRAYLSMRKDRITYLKVLQSVRVIQERWRGTLLMRQERANFLILSKIFAEKRKKNNAATKIQTIWRGYITRKRQSKRMKLIRQRTEEANLKATVENTIGFKCSKAIDYLFSDKVTILSVIFALNSLDVLTKICPTACEDSVNMIAEQIFVIFELANRSEPYRQACTHGVNVLINLITYQKTKSNLLSLIDVEKMNILLNLMSRWADKEFTLFPYLCTFVWIMCQNEEQKQLLRNTPYSIESLRKMYSKAKRMETMKSNKLQNGGYQRVQEYKLPLVNYSWWNVETKFPTRFTNALFGITCILKIFNEN